MLIGIDAHCLEGHRTGAGRYLFNILKEWVMIGPKTDLRFILYFKNEISRDIPESKLFEKKNLGVGSNFLFEQLHLPLAARRDHVDLLFCPSYQQPIFYSGKSALTIHDIIYQAHPEWHNWHSCFEKAIFQYIFRCSAKKSSLIFAPSDFTKQEIVKNYRISGQKIKVTPYAVDNDFRVLEKNSEFQKKLSALKKKYGVGERYILYIGNIFERRFLPEIISAFSELKEPSLQFFIVGRDYTKKNIDRLIEQKNQQIERGAIKRVDYVEEKELVFLYNGAEVFIWLSSYEGFGFPPLEAMACGVPVITTNLSSLGDVVGNSAFIIKEPDNILEIKKALKRVLADKQLRAELIEFGSSQAQKFSWSRCAEETLKALRIFV